MRRLLSILAVSGLVVTVPQAIRAQDTSRPPDLSGAYMANGTGAGDDHEPYEAKVELKRTGDVVVPMADPAWHVELYRLKWKFPGNGGELNGVGALIGETFYVAYTDEKKFFLEFYWPWNMTATEKAVEARVVEMEGESSGNFVKNRPWYSDLDEASEYVGVWFHYDETFGVGGLTRETWTGQHRYRLHQVNDKFEWAKYGNKKFWMESGTLTVERTGRNSVVKFRESEDYSYSGVAITTPKGLIVAGVGGNKIAGVSVYRFTAKGLEGVWAQQGGEGRGTELLTPSADVLKKAGGLFHD
jgi:hypothetical protein